MLTIREKIKRSANAHPNRYGESAQIASNPHVLCWCTIGYTEYVSLSYADPRGPFDDLQTAIRGELETLDPQGLRGGECRGAYTLLDGGTNGPRYLWKQEFRGLIRVA